MATSWKVGCRDSEFVVVFKRPGESAIAVRAFLKLYFDTCSFIASSRFLFAPKQAHHIEASSYFYYFFEMRLHCWKNGEAP